MSTPNGGGYGGGYYIPPHTPTRMHTPVQVYNTGHGAQHSPYGQWPGAMPNAAPGMRHHPGGSGHRSITHSPAPYSQQQVAPTGPDMPTVLLSLADTYINAAHSNGYKTALGAGADVKAYYALVATGLRCLEAVLQYRLQPRVEATVRLRYASILYEETDNLDEAEDALNKAVLLAARNNLTDLKCSMQYLLVKIMFKNSHKAALKMLNTYLSDVEILDIPLWTYSFRFLRFHLQAEASPAHDDQGAINTLRGMYTMSKERGDMKIAALASLLEAMVSFRNGADGVEAAQRALARVFTQQNAGNEIPPQLEVLAQILDICCSLMLGRSQECDAKIRKLHAMLDQPDRWIDWKDDGDFEVTMNPSRSGRPPETLKLRWLNKDDVFTLGYFLSGLCKFQKNVEENGKAERFLTEGMKTVERISTGYIHSSLEASKSKLAWKQNLKSYMYLYHTFLLCMRTDWDTAFKILKQLEDASLSLSLDPGSPLALQILYLRAVISHGTNNPSAAFGLYSTIFNTLPVDHELSIISRLNCVLLTRIQDPAYAEALLTSVERHCAAHKNDLIKAAYIAVKATERGELVKTKNYLALALRNAAAAGNVQLTFIVLNFMCHRFFAGVVSEQAEKSAKAAMQNAKKGRDTLWTFMGGQMYADCLGRKGNDLEESRQRDMNEIARQEVIRNLTRHLPAEATIASVDSTTAAVTRASPEYAYEE